MTWRSAAFPTHNSAVPFLGIATIGWNALGDLTEVTRDAFAELRDRVKLEDPEYASQGAGQVWRFAHDISEGDLIVANSGTTEVLGIGRVIGPYSSMPPRTTAIAFPWSGSTPTCGASTDRDGGRPSCRCRDRTSRRSAIRWGTRLPCFQSTAPRICPTRTRRRNHRRPHRRRRRLHGDAPVPSRLLVRRLHGRHAPAERRRSTALASLLEDINKPINAHYRIGISFFLVRDLEQHLGDIWRMEIEPYLEDVVDNQILAWTLSRIAQSSALGDSARPIVRNALRTVRNAATERPFRAVECVDRLYNRLNSDYEQLHLLCRFFLEHTGPTLTDGEARTVPFVVNMARLFELFVAEWLRAYFRTHAPRYTVRWQDHATLGDHDQLQFNIDIVLHDRDFARDIAVIDAKYMVPDRVSNDDVGQITLYAQLRDCRDAMLVYPAMPKRVLDATTPQHRIRTLWFGLEGDLEAAGRRFASALLSLSK